MRAFDPNQSFGQSRLSQAFDVAFQHRRITKRLAFGTSDNQFRLRPAVINRKVTNWFRSMWAASVVSGPGRGRMGQGEMAPGRGPAAASGNRRLGQRASRQRSQPIAKRFSALAQPGPSHSRA